MLNKARALLIVSMLALLLVACTTVQAGSRTDSLNEPVPVCRFAPVWSSAMEQSTMKKASRVVIVSPNDISQALLGSASGGLIFHSAHTACSESTVQPGRESLPFELDRREPGRRSGSNRQVIP